MTVSPTARHTIATIRQRGRCGRWRRRNRGPATAGRSVLTNRLDCHLAIGEAVILLTLSLHRY